jgi:hypothetical protein
LVAMFVVSFYCEVSDTGSVGWASSYFYPIECLLQTVLLYLIDIRVPVIS